MCGSIKVYFINAKQFVLESGVVLETNVTPSTADTILDNKDHGANMEPTWVLSAPGGPHAGPMNLATRDHIPGAQVAFTGKMGTEDNTVKH